MSNESLNCVVCGRVIGPEETIYEVPAFIDPMPPNGYGCSERCAREAARQSQLRSYLFIDLMNGKG